MDACALRVRTGMAQYTNLFVDSFLLDVHTNLFIGYVYKNLFIYIVYM